MAIIKHIAIKNSNYDAASDYLTTKHDEFTSRPILDGQGRRIPRDEYILDGINCNPFSFNEECDSVNAHFGKNTRRSEIKAHHYIISFDPRDRDENGLTPEHAQELGMAFARKNFPGHQILVCMHPDGHTSAGNIHVHIVLNSVRAFDVDRQDFMDRPGDTLAGNKHHVTKEFLDHLKAQTMEMCQKEQLNQVDLLTPAKVRITDREYWAQRRGQRDLDMTAAQQNTTGSNRSVTFKTEKMILREAITATMMDASSYEDFQKKLLENYGISVHESRGKISYLMPDKAKPIRGARLGTDFEKDFILRFIASNRIIPKAKHPAADTEHISKGSRALSSTGNIPRLITDIESCIKAQESRAYAQKVKVGNLQQMSRTLIFLREQGIGSVEELESICASTKADFDEKRSALKATEAKLRQVNSLIHATGQYLSTKSVHAEYLKAKSKKQFRKEHSSELAIYDAALKELKACYGDQKFQAMKQLKERKTALTAAKNEQYEDFCFARSRHREIQTVHANVRAMLDRQPDRNQSQEKHRN